MAKKILVTGADGFIGSHLAELLVKQGFSVRSLAAYNSFNSWGWLDESPLNSEMEILTGDIRDPHYCKVLTKGVDFVYHLAALIAIPYSFTAPDSYIETNIKGTANICRASLDAGVTRILHTSTSEVYGSAMYVPIDEKHPLQPQSPYSASKIGSDAMAMSFYYSFGLPVTIARPFNTYGPRQSARAVIPTIISQLAAGSKQVKLGDLRPTRDFNFVADTCEGMVALLSSSKTIGKTINIGSNFEISIGETFELIKNLMGSSAQIAKEDERLRPPNAEVQRLWCDNTQLQELTGFKPNVSLKEGLKITIDWFSNPQNLKRYKTHLYNV